MTTFKLQCLLGALGYLGPGEQDGIDGPRTRAALARFTADHGAGEEGLIGVLTKMEDTPETGTFWDHIRWFRREEFRCKCGGRYCSGYPAEMQEAVVKIADAAREHFGRPGHVISGLRCVKWNDHCGGVANSQHMYGEAVDLRIDGVDSETLRQFVSQQPGHRYSYRINETNVHFDMEKQGR